MRTKIWILSLAFCASAFAEAPSVATLKGTFRPATAPIRDEVFLQEVSFQVPSKTPLTAIGVSTNGVFAGTEEGLLILAGETLRPVESVSGAVRRIVQLDGILWIATREALYRQDGPAWQKFEQPGVVDLASFNGSTVIATPAQLFRLDGARLLPLTDKKTPFAVERLAAFNDSLFFSGNRRLTFFDGKSFGGTDVYGSSTDLAWDWGAPPSLNFRDPLAVGPSLYVATDRGVGILRGMTFSSLRGTNGLPFEDTTCLARGFTNDLWIGTRRGAIRKLPSGEFHYFSGRRWLPAEGVRAIAVASNDVWLATAGGLAAIQYKPMTLAAKAAFYEHHLQQWGQKRLGLVHKLEWDDEAGEYVREAGDNDGGYSSDYLSAQSYRYAVTHDPEARAEAVDTFHALRWLESMTGIPGFPARSVWVKGEKGHKSSHGSGGYPAEWHDVGETSFEWKGDTSSDELCAHFYAFNLFLDLASQGAEIAQARRHLQRIATHLLDHDWQLLDLDGKPTRWGRWDPGYFATEEGRFDQGLQSVEILSFMKTAAELTGEDRFATGYSRLIELGYPEKTLRQRVVFPPDSVANFEDQLSFWAYWNLLRRESDPILKSLYRRSFERTWEVLRVEQQPWFNFVYGTLTGNDCEPERAVAHLREWPVDLVIYTYENSHRADLVSPPGYSVVKAAIRPFSPREREPMRWDAWTMQADGGTEGRDVVEPSGWLLAYWMGRYHGFISPPEAEVNSEINVQVHRGHRLGAQPYNGPSRPEIP